MQTDLSTPVARRCAAREHRHLLHSAFLGAMETVRHCDPRDKKAVGDLVSQAAHTRHRIAVEARHLGYARRCREAIPTCGGECCRWHFPKRLSVADFVIMTWEISPGEFRQLEKRVAAPASGPYQCPLLTPEGCCLSYDRRPLICASAYPCFAGEAYHRMTAEQTRRLQPILDRIERLAAG